MTQRLLVEEISFYERHFEEYRRRYAGRYLLIHGSRLIGDYEDELAANYEGYRQAYGDREPGLPGLEGWRAGGEDGYGA